MIPMYSRLNRRPTPNALINRMHGEYNHLIGPKESEDRCQGTGWVSEDLVPNRASAELEIVGCRPSAFEAYSADFD